MIRVCHVITSLDVGGAQQMLLKLLRATDRTAFEPSVVSLVAGGPLLADFERTGVAVHELGMRPGAVQPRGVLRLARLLRAKRPDVVQSWLVHADLAATLASKLAGVRRLAWNIRSAGQADERTSRLRRAVTWVCARLSSAPDVIVANSRRGQSFHASLGYRPSRWEVIPNGFELEPPPTEAERAEARRELGWDAGELVALTIGRWHPSKGIDVLLDAAGRVRGERLRFALVGSDVERSNPDVASRVGAANVELLGLRRDVGRLLAACDLYVSPSRFEGFPNVLGEALGAARPCVATDAGDSRDIVGDAGLVVPTEDAHALAAAIQELVDRSPEERARLGALGRARVEREYAIDRVVGRYEALYRELVGGVGCAA